MLLLLQYSFNLAEAGEPPVEEPAPVQTPQTGGAVPSSGRWVRVDSDTVRVYGRMAIAYGHTSPARLKPLVRVGGGAVARGQTSVASVALMWRPVPVRAAMRGEVRMTGRIKRDDTAEIMRLIDMIEFMKRAA